MPSAAERGADLVEFIAKGLVDDLEAVNVSVGDDGRTLELETSADDRGRVIGRQGRVAKAMRLLLAKAAGGADLRLDIVD
jgi:predicted RNA-binding protein YlqC (UPF0109 family)